MFTCSEMTNGDRQITAPVSDVGPRPSPWPCRPRPWPSALVLQCLVPCGLVNITALEYPGVHSDWSDHMIHSYLVGWQTTLCIIIGADFLSHCVSPSLCLPLSLSVGANWTYQWLRQYAAVKRSLALRSSKSRFIKKRNYGTSLPTRPLPYTVLVAIAYSIIRDRLTW